MSKNCNLSPGLFMPILGIAEFHAEHNSHDEEGLGYFSKETISTSCVYDM